VAPGGSPGPTVRNRGASAFRKTISGIASPWGREKRLARLTALITIRSPRRKFTSRGLETQRAVSLGSRKANLAGASREQFQSKPFLASARQRTTDPETKNKANDVEEEEGTSRKGRLLYYSKADPGSTQHRFKKLDGAAYKGREGARKGDQDNLIYGVGRRQIPPKR